MLKLTLIIVFSLTTLTISAPYYYSSSSSSALGFYNRFHNNRDSNKLRPKQYNQKELQEEQEEQEEQNLQENEDEGDLEEQNVQENSDENSSEENSSEEKQSSDYSNDPVIIGQSYSYLEFSVSTESPALGSTTSSQTQSGLTSELPVTKPVVTSATVYLPTEPPIKTTVPSGLPGDIDYSTVVAGRGEAPAVNAPRINRITTETPPTVRKITKPVHVPTKAPCKTACPLQAVFENVCASNGVSYISMCLFEAVMCIENTPEIVVLHIGACEVKQLEPETKFVPDYRMP